MRAREKEEIVVGLKPKGHKSPQLNPKGKAEQNLSLKTVSSFVVILTGVFTTCAMVLHTQLPIHVAVWPCVEDLRDPARRTVVLFTDGMRARPPHALTAADDGGRDNRCGPGQAVAACVLGGGDPVHHHQLHWRLRGRQH